MCDLICADLPDLMHGVSALLVEHIWVHKRRAVKKYLPTLSPSYAPQGTSVLITLPDGK